MGNHVLLPLLSYLLQTGFTPKSGLLFPTLTTIVAGRPLPLKEKKIILYLTFYKNVGNCILTASRIGADRTKSQRVFFPPLLPCCLKSRVALMNWKGGKKRGKKKKGLSCQISLPFLEV